ncbi:hypothetical protein EDB89DRAFT_2072228 [Lactarius sanguifluus]|nr:hypothetical protein EDB89DRAFT_2072228 [Lactarius sanguifluus]
MSSSQTFASRRSSESTSYMRLPHRLVPLAFQDWPTSTPRLFLRFLRHHFKRHLPFVSHLWFHKRLSQSAGPPKLSPSRHPTTNSATDLSELVHGLEIAGFGTSSSASALEKRPTFALHRRICDDPAFTVELPSYPSLQFAAIYKGVGSTISFGSGWRNVIWYGIGGWASRDRVLSVLFPSKLILKKEPSPSVYGSPCGRSKHTSISFTGRLLLLQTYLAKSAWYIGRGANALPIGDLYAATRVAIRSRWRQAPGSAWRRVIQSAFGSQKNTRRISRMRSRTSLRGGAPGRRGTFRVCCCRREVAGVTLDRLGWDENEALLYEEGAGARERDSEMTFIAAALNEWIFNHHLGPGTRSCVLVASSIFFIAPSI